MNTLLRAFNTLLLTGILIVLILLFLRMPPIRQAGKNISALRTGGEPIAVTIDNEPLQVEITR